MSAPEDRARAIRPGSESRAPSCETRRRRVPRGLLLACGVFLALRGLLLVTAFDRVSMPAFELHVLGSLARQHLGGGGGIPLWMYYDNSGGQLLVSYLAAAAYSVLGPSYLTLKLVTLGLNLGALVLLWSLLRRLVSERAATLAALLVALGPATLVKYSLYACGNHAENLFFTMLALHSFFELHRRGVTRGRLVWAGFASGLAVFVFLGAVTPVLLLLALHLGLRGWRKSLGDAPAGLGGLALGLAPLMWINLAFGGRGAAFLDAKFGAQASAPEPAAVLARLWEFFTVQLPSGAAFPDLFGLPGALADGLHFAALALVVSVLLPAASRGALALARGALGGGVEEAASPAVLARALESALVAYVPLTAVAYALSNLQMGDHVGPMRYEGYRYLLPYFTFAAVLTALAAFGGAAGRARLRACVGRGAALAALLSGVFALADVDWSFSQPNVGARYDGFNVKQNARTLLNLRNGLYREQVVDHAEAFAPLFRTRVYHGLGHYAAWRAEVEGRALDLTELLADLPLERRGEAARGVGTFLRTRSAQPGRLRPEHDALLASWLAGDVAHARQAVEGLGSEWEVMLASETRRVLDTGRRLLETSSERLRPSLARGVGLECGRLLARGVPGDVQPVRRLVEDTLGPARAELLHGLGAGLVDGHERVRAIHASLEVQLRGRDRARVVEGARERAAEIWHEAEASERAAAIALP